MATRFTATHSPDDIDQLLYLKNAQGSYCGFKTGFISENLNRMKGYLVTCIRCKGIIRDASSCEGETVCKLCNTNQLNPKKVQRVRNSVAELNIKCPLLRDCGWSGKLLEGEKHLKVCGSFLITCPLGCRNAIKRCEMNDHLKTYCLYREVKCEFCDLSIAIKNLTEHLLMCPAHPVVCKCRRSMRRDEVEEHIDKDCELTEIECPYAKYSCKIGKILKKDLLAHKKEFYIEHQDMIERENSLLTEKVKILELCNSQVVERHDLLEGKMKEKNNQLMQNHELMKRKMTNTDQLVQKHDLLEGKMKTEHDQSVHKHNLLERKIKTNHDQLIQEHAQLRGENNQQLQRLTTMEWLSSSMAQQLSISKRLVGTQIDSALRSNVVLSTEFGNGQYRFVYEITSSVDTRTISLRRLPTSTYSNKNILCITECMLCLQGTRTEIIPYYLCAKLSSRIGSGMNVPLIVLTNNLIAKYRQHDGIVQMDMYFDYDYITYKGFLGVFDG